MHMPPMQVAVAFPGRGSLLLDQIAALSSLSVLTALEAAPAVVHGQDKQETNQADT